MAHCRRKTWCLPQLEVHNVLLWSWWRTEPRPKIW